MPVQKIVYILLLLTSTAFSVQAQKFVNLDNRWRMIAYPNWVGTHPYLTFFKDSVEIEGKYYYQRYTSVDSTLQVIDTTGEYYREEAGIVYHRWDNRYPFLPKEIVIYNFNLNIGDSIDLVNYRLKVVKIDSITLLDGSKRKRWELSTRRFFRSLYWVEGIGGVDIETLRPHYAPLSDGTSNCSCYFYKKEALYSNPYYGESNVELSCSLKLADPVSTHNHQELNSLTILQNQGDGEIVFQLNEPGKYQYHLYNATGAMLQQNLLAQGTHRISLTLLPHGIYFLRILDTERWQQKTLKIAW